VVELKTTPGVITAIQDMARLETTNYHVEKVVEAADTQAHLWGLLKTKDDLLLIAAGDVVAGVDLGQVRDEDVRVDPVARSVYVRLPSPEVLSSSLDQRATHVYSRHTDVLAERREQLEGEARRQAEDQMRAQAIDAGILDRARTSADRTLRALLQAMGYERVELDWRDRG
jgi:guanylate kinase